MKRLLSMDILRGIALMLMVIFHIFLNISDLTTKALNNMASLGIGELILVAFIAVFIHWQSFFCLISAIVHWYTMSKMLEKGVSPGRILGKQMLFGGALYIFGFLREPFLSPWGILFNWFYYGGFSNSGQFPWHLWGFIYRFETLSNIGISIMLTSLIFVVLTSLNKAKISEIGKLIIKLSVLAVIALVFIFTAPLIQDWVNAVAGGLNLQAIESYTDLNVANGYADRWLLNTLGGREFPLFPNFAYFLVGAMIGACLSQEHPTKRILFGFVIAGIILTGIGAYYWLFIDQLLVTFNIGFHVHPTGFVIFSIGLELLILTLFLRMNEFNPRLLNEIRMKRRLKWSRIFRRWGLLALTIFTFNAFELVVRGIFDRLFPSVGFRTGNIPLLPMVVIIIALLLLWEGIIRLLELLKFKVSIEWIFLRLFKLGKSYNKADPLDIKGNLYDVTPILFVSPPIQEEVQPTP